MSTTNEMSDDYANGGYKAMEPSIAVSLPVTTPDDSYDASIAVGSPESDVAAKFVSVYPTSITPVSYATDDPIVTFDIVFSVTCSEDGIVKTYQVVKRIGIDRHKIAQDAKQTVPISVVEEKAPKEGNARLLQLAGLKKGS